MIPIENQENLENIVSHAPIGICILDAGTLISEIVNDKFLEVAGKPREAIAGKFYWDSFAEVREAYEPALNKVIRDGEAFHANEAELMLIRNGKEEMVFVNFVYSPIKDKQGKVTKVAVWVLENTAQVIARHKIEETNTELQKAQQDLRKTFLQLEESETALRLAIDAANFGTWYIHSVTRAFITDARLRELFGYFPDENITIEDAVARITDEYREFVATALEKAIYLGGDYDVTYPVIGFHDRQLRWLRAIGNLKADPSGEFSAFTGVVMDVTEKMLDEQRKNTFIGMVSHELKTPLTSLKAIIQVASGKLKKSEDSFLTGAMEKAGIQLKRMSDMINGFLNVSRLESGKMPIRKQRFNLGLLLTGIIEETNLVTATHFLNLETCDNIEVYADPDQISSVITNLINNALKYSPKSKYIHVSCKAGNDQVTVSVRDEGIGIKAEDQERIFERYQRVETGQTQQISGFGIGLYLSSEIIKGHNGTIWVESKSKEGSTFYFSLPLKQD
jgi:two-component system sensor histidine kinase VicK